MAVLEAKEYREAQEALAADPIMMAMAIGLAGVPREEIAWEDGGVRHEFMMGAMREYQSRGGKVASYGMGHYAKALLLLLDGKAAAETMMVFTAVTEARARFAAKEAGA